MSMAAQVGDEVSVESHRLRGSRRSGSIVEVLGQPGHEYYRVRWQDGRETVFHPGSDAVVVSKRRRPRRPARAAPAATAPAAPETPTAERAKRKPRSRGRRTIAPGDRLVIKGHHLGQPDRDAEILEVLGEHGGPPYRVRWADSGRETLLFPGADAVVEHYRRRRRRTAG